MTVDKTQYGVSFEELKRARDDYVACVQQYHDTKKALEEQQKKNEKPVAEQRRDAVKSEAGNAGQAVADEVVEFIFHKLSEEPYAAAHVLDALNGDRKTDVKALADELGKPFVDQNDEPDSDLEELLDDAEALQDAFYGVLWYNEKVQNVDTSELYTTVTRKKNGTKQETVELDVPRKPYRQSEDGGKKIGRPANSERVTFYVNGTEVPNDVTVPRLATEWLGMGMTQLQAQLPDGWATNGFDGVEVNGHTLSATRN